MAHLSLSLLGPFQVTLDGQPIADFRTNKARALLAYLAVEAHRRPGEHSRQTLAGLLWPDKPERAALANLRNTLANLRKAIGDRSATPAFLQITRETIQFNRASDHWLDVTRFQALVEIAAVPAGANRPIHRRLQEAVGLYRGDLLAGFSVRDSPAFEEWVLHLRERLHWQTLEALGTLAAYYEGRGAYEEAIACARRQVELEPWREDAHRTLMRALDLSGQRAAALAQFEACRQVLAEELGVEPGAETKGLYEQIRDGQVTRSSGPDSRSAGQAVEHSDAPRSRQAEAHDQMLRGQSYQEQGEDARARACFERAALLYRELGLREQEASARVQLGRILAHQAHHAEALAELEQAFLFYHETGMQWDKAAVLVDLGLLYRDRGEFTSSLMHVYPALGIYREMYRQQGHEDPLAYLDERFRYLAPPAVLRSVQQPTPERDTNLHEPTFGGTRQKAVPGGDPSILLAIARSLLIFVSVRRAWGNDTAQRCLEDCSAICHRAGFKNELGIAFALRGSRPFLCRAMQIGIELGSTEPLLYALWAFARMLAKQGQTELAIELGAVALRECSTTYNTRWLEHTAARSNEPQGTGYTLPRQVVAQARARGRARDLWATIEELYAVWCE